MYLIEQINHGLIYLNNYIYSHILIFLLLSASIYYTLHTKFAQFDVKNIIYAFKEDIDKNQQKSTRKISPFQAFALTTASRVGTGNLAGVALAIVTGGPGAIFWMWIIALLGASLAFAESTLAQIYKVKNKSTDLDTAEYYGGPPYYISQGLGSKSLAICFSVLLIFVLGFSFNAVQANTIAQSFQSTFNTPILLNAIILSGITGVFIIKGLPYIAKVSALLVPFMAIFYLILCLFVIGANISKLPYIFRTIFESAFGLKEFSAGTLSGTIATGIKRGLFSNEAGMGSAPNAAASPESSHPVKQGFIQAFGVFFDTILICSATGFLILFSGIDISNPEISGITLTQQALQSYFGHFGNIFLSFCILLVAFSSILGNYFYTQNSLSFLTKNKLIITVVNLGVILSVFLGSISSFRIVWNIADLLMGVMTIINLYALMNLSQQIKSTLQDYRAQKMKNKDPRFEKKNIKGFENLDCW